MGLYVPKGRLSVAELRQHWPGVPTPGGVRTISVPGFDEDIVTMGIEAAMVALETAGLPAESIDLLIVATCSSPYIEHSAAAEVARALGLPTSVNFIDLAGSTLGGVTALVTACNAVRSGTSTRALVVASERRRGAPGTAVEALGSGAIAAVISEDAPSTLGSNASIRHGVPTRWRSESSAVLRNYDDSRYELVEQIQPAVTGVLEALADSPTGYLAIGPLDVRSRTAIRRTLKVEIDVDAYDFSETGDLGAAGPLFDLAEIVAKQTVASIACVGVEPGSGASGLVLEVHGAVPVSRHQPEPVAVSYVEYLQRFGALEGPVPPSPIVPYASTPGASRSDLEGSLAGDRCDACGTLNIPPRRLCVECGSLKFTRERVTRFGTIVTYNVQHVVAISPEPSPVAVGVIRLQDEKASRGGQVSAMFSDSNLEELRIGHPVELIYRRIGLDDGLVKYGWKARTLTTAAVDEPRGDPSNQESGVTP